MGRIAPLVGVLLLACLFVGDAFLSPAWADWTTPDGITWWSNPNPSKVGKCIGNCGKDCSNSLNPCTSKFPDTGYWTSRVHLGSQLRPIDRFEQRVLRRVAATMDGGRREYLLWV